MWQLTKIRCENIKIKETSFYCIDFFLLAMKRINEENEMILLDIFFLFFVFTRSTKIFLFTQGKRNSFFLVVSASHWSFV